MTNTKEHPLIYVIESVFLLFLILAVGSVSYYLITRSSLVHFAAPKIIADFIEADQLHLLRKSNSVELNTQNTAAFDQGVWSNDDHLFVHNVSLHDSLSFVLPVTGESNYKIIIHLTRSYDYGEWDIKINEKRITTIDLFDANVRPAEPLDLGTHFLTPSRNVVSFTVVGRNKNARPPYYQLGIDGVEIKKVDENP